MDGDEQIIETLKAAREAAGLSQRALASRVGLPQSYISKIEGGGVDIRLGSLIELARVLGLEVKLVPRKAVPAVDSIIRQTAPTVAHDQQARVREALSKAVAVADRLADFDRLQTLPQIRDAAHLLQHVPVPPEDLEAIRKALEALRPLDHFSLDTATAEEIEAVLESPKVRRGLKDAARTLQTVRNRAAHHPAHVSERPRPAYQLDEEDDDG